MFYPSRTFFLFNNALELDRSVATASCASGTSWNGSVCQATAMTGTLTPAAPSCTIAAGASTCNVALTWTTTNPVGVSAITSNTPSANFTLFTGNNSTGSAPVFYPSRTFFLFNNALELDRSVATASCASGTSWNGSACAAVPALASCSVWVESQTARFEVSPTLPPAAGVSNQPLTLKVFVKEEPNSAITHPDATLEFIEFGPVAYSGGHDHDDNNRPKGRLEVGAVSTDGSIRVVFTPPEVSGKITFKIKATTQNSRVCSSSTQTIDVKIGRLEVLGSSPDYDLVGAKTGKHVDTHYGTVAFNEKLRSLARAYANKYPGSKLEYNDMSLVFGGRFDYKIPEKTWQKPHAEHELGKNVDLCMTAGLSCARNVPATRRWDLFQMIKANHLNLLVENPDGEGYHWHLRDGYGPICEILGSTEACDGENIGPKSRVTSEATNEIYMQSTVLVDYDPSTRLYTYAYSFRNETTSLLDASSIQLPLKGATLLNIHAPQGWKAALWENNAAVEFAVEDSGNLPANYVDDGNLLPSPYQIKPGQTLSGFSFQTPYAAGTIDFLAQGFKPIPVLDDDAGQQPSVFDGGFRGTTTGPVFPGNLYPNKIDEPWYFTNQHYADFLNRRPDPSGLAFWTNELTSCGSSQSCIDLKRINVSAAYFLSIEFQQTGYLVERLYKASYGSDTGNSRFGGDHTLSVPIVRFNEFLPDTQRIGQGVVVGQAGWEGLLENNKQSFVAEFVSRTRFTSAFPASMTPAQFVDVLDINAGNPLSMAERNQLVTDLSTNAKTRAQVLRAVAEDADLVNAEFNRAFVLMQFFGYLRRNPNDPQDTDYTGYDFWVTKLNQFNGNFQNAEMVKAFINSGEYRQRFGP